jgi:phospholipase/lecithinase/hemolysin
MRTGQLYIFGDSLSDDGALAVQSEPEPIDIYFAGRASNGPVWHEYIRNDLAIAPGASAISQAPNFDGYLSGSPLNGINFAHSGAVSDSDSKPHLPGAVQQAEGFAALVGSGDIPAPDDQDVFVIWIGGNDFLDLADASISDFFDILNLDTTIVDNIEETVDTLAATGAQNFLILGQPTIGGAFLGDRAPSGSLVATLWNSLTNEFNDTLSSYVSDLDSGDGVSALFVDIAAFVEELEDDPAAFGFSNVTSDIFSDDAPLDDQSYFSVDGIHPTGAGHAAIAEYVVQTAAAAGFDLTAMAGNVVPGSARDDDLMGTAGPDSLTGEGGDDTLTGGDGEDIAILQGAQALYTLTIGDDITLTDRSGVDGTDTLREIEFLDFSDGRFDLTRFDDGVSLTGDQFRSLTEVYVSYFNRAPDALGLLFWADALANGTTLDRISNAFAMSEEGLEVFPLDAQLFEFVSSVYQNTLGRAGDDAGVNFWANALQSGGVGRGDFVLRVLEGARATPPEDATPEFLAQQVADRAYLDGKIDIGLYVATQLGLSDVAAASDIMALYDGSGQSVAAAIAAADQTSEVASGIDGSGQFLIELVGIGDALSIV